MATLNNIVGLESITLNNYISSDNLNLINKTIKVSQNAYTSLNEYEKELVHNIRNAATNVSNFSYLEEFAFCVKYVQDIAKNYNKLMFDDNVELELLPLKEVFKYYLTYSFSNFEIYKVNNRYIKVDFNDSDSLYLLNDYQILLNQKAPVAHIVEEIAHSFQTIKNETNMIKIICLLFPDYENVKNKIINNKINYKLLNQLKLDVETNYKLNDLKTEEIKFII